MRELQANQTTLATSMQEATQEQASQLHQFKTQVNAQHVHLEQSIQAQSTQIQSFQDTFREQFAQQVAHQQQMLDGMFGRQMTQFKALMSKQAARE